MCLQPPPSDWSGLDMFISLLREGALADWLSLVLHAGLQGTFVDKTHSIHGILGQIARWKSPYRNPTGLCTKGTQKNVY